MTTPSSREPGCADTLNLQAADHAPDAQQETQASDELRQQLMQLAVIAAHQLKSPLHSVHTSLNLLLGGFVGGITAAQRGVLERATGAAYRGSQLVSDLLRLRSLDVMSAEDLVPVHAVDSLRVALDRVRDAAERGGVELTSRIELAEPLHGWVMAEPTLVQEAFYVVLDNAVKYTPSGGRVTVRLYRPQLALQLPPAPTEGQQSGGAQLALLVEDDGIGIPEDAWPQLFDEFFRATNAREMTTDGTGLGLAFTARALHLLGGRLRIEARDPRGVRATMALHTATPELLERAGHSLEPDEAQPVVSKRVVVVGGVAAGAKAAARIARIDPRAEVTVVERGQFLSYAGCGLPYYISGAVREQRALLSSPLGEVRDSSFFHALKNVRALEVTNATAIDRERRRVRVRRLTDGREWELSYDHLVLATGARASLPSIEGRDLAGVYTLHGVSDAEAIRSELLDRRAKEVVIVGGGLLGCQITESVALRGARITLVEERAEILGIVDPELARLVERHMERQGVRVIKGDAVNRLIGRQGRLSVVQLASGRELPCDFAILATGVKPEVSLATRAGLELGPTGAIKVDEKMRTSDPLVFAVGDCSENRHLLTDLPCWFPLGSTANKEGRVAASVICGQDDSYEGVLGSMVLKVFDWTVATTGLSATEARAAGFDPITALIPGPDRAHYLPSARAVVFKLVADRGSRKVLGLQGVGPGEIAKRIDIIATAISAGLNLDTISRLDLAYAPPYSQALDNVLTAANVLRNKLDGLFEGITAPELRRRLEQPDPPLLLDVRLASEYDTVRLTKSLHIPLGALRGRLQDLPRDRQIVTIGKIGLRAYEAALVLQANGFERVVILDGGIDPWPYELEEL